MASTKTKKTIKGISNFLFFYLIWTCYSTILISSNFFNKKITKGNLSLTSYLSDYETIFLFSILLLCFYYFSLLYSRLDGKFYFPNRDHFLVSIKRFLRTNSLTINTMVLIVTISVMTLFLDSKNSNLIMYYVLFLSGILITVGFIKMILKKLSFWHAFLISCLVWGMLLTSKVFFEKSNLLIKNFVYLLLVTILLSIFIYMIFNISKVLKVLKAFIFDTIFSESYVAEQSKIDHQNIEILKKIYENTDQNQSLPFKTFISEIQTIKRKLFLIEYDTEDSRGFSKKSKSDFLDLSKPQHFFTFLKRLENSYDSEQLKDYDMLFKQIKKIYIENNVYFREDIMLSRTESIKQRNISNLFTSLMLLLFTIITVIVSPYISINNLFVFHIIIFFVFVRLCLRGFEIGRSFYQDITVSQYPKSLLNGTDRIYLAIKSIFEIVILSSSIYLSYYVLGLDNDERIEVTGIVRTILYSFCLSLFNISFPGNNKELIFYLTHSIQVTLSIILITIGVSGYLNRAKYPIFFEYIYKNEVYKIVKTVNLKTPIKINVIQISLPSSELANKSFIVEEAIKKAYVEGKIDEATYEHLVKESSNCIPKGYPINKTW